MVDVYELVTNRIISLLEECEKKGTKLPWEKGWIRPIFKGKKIKVKADESIAYNAITGNVYSLLNQMLLGKDGAWATFKQIESLGGKIRKGEKSSIIVFWDSIEKKTENANGEEEKTIVPFLKYYSVFHIETQTDGVNKEKIKAPTYETMVGEIEMPNNEIEVNAIADEILTTYTTINEIKVNSEIIDQAFYIPSTDSITLPKREQFKTSQEYYGTFFHEAVHSTGHEKRLNRLKIGCMFFGNENYAKEELVAEIGSASIMNMLGIENERSIENNTAYIQNWLKALKNDKKLIVGASSKAEKAVDLILGNK